MKKTLVAATAGALLMACGGIGTMATAPPETDITALELACVREPLDAAKWEELAAALAIGGERERAATMYLQAATLRAHDVRGDYALLKQELRDARAAEAEAEAEAADMPRTRVRRLGAALVEVLRIPAAGAAQAPPQASSPASIVRLEISNGNGVTGAAARLARSLDVDGWKTVRLSNLRPFVVPLSRIEYRHEQKPLAQRLGDRFNLPLHRLRGDPARADMRIVLGHDARHLK